MTLYVAGAPILLLSGTGEAIVTVLTIVISAGSAIVAYLAREDSKKSADASAQISKEMRDLAVDSNSVAEKALGVAREANEQAFRHEVIFTVRALQSSVDALIGKVTENANSSVVAAMASAVQARLHELELLTPDAGLARERSVYFLLVGSALSTGVQVLQFVEDNLSRPEIAGTPLFDSLVLLDERARWMFYEIAAHVAVSLLPNVANTEWDGLSNKIHGIFSKLFEEYDSTIEEVNALNARMGLPEYVDVIMNLFRVPPRGRNPGGAGSD